MGLPHHHSLVLSLAAASVAFGTLCGGANAQGTSAGSGASGGAEAVAATPNSTPSPAPPEGILPIPDYTGSWWERSSLLGDFGEPSEGRSGPRTRLAENGLQAQVDLIQYVQGVVAGGRDTATRYGGSADYLILADLQRMGLLPGAIITFRGESRFGDSINSRARALLPVNTDLYFPLTGDPDDGLPFAITELTYTQYLSRTVALFIGKLNTLGGDANEFASGRGKTQFGNSDFVFNPVTALTVPYSTLGGGALWAITPHVTLVGSVFNTADSTTTAGFDDIGEGWTANGEAQFKYELGRLPGGQNVGFTYAADGDFVDIRTKFSFDDQTGLTVASTDDTWCVYWSGWQYVWADESDATPIDAANGRPDRRGIGLFARAGFGDDETLPIEWHLSGGVGGRGLVPSRPNDHFGVGVSYSAVRTGRLVSAAGVRDRSVGFEGFYNLAITPASELTFSVQAIDDVNSNTDTAVVLGCRLRINF